jgi:hypothetical protein
VSLHETRLVIPGLTATDSVDRLRRGWKILDVHTRHGGLGSRIGWMWWLREQFSRVVFARNPLCVDDFGYNKLSNVHVHARTRHRQPPPLHVTLGSWRAQEPSVINVQWHVALSESRIENNQLVDDPVGFLCCVRSSNKPCVSGVYVCTEQPRSKCKHAKIM